MAASGPSNAYYASVFLFPFKSTTDPLSFEKTFPNVSPDTLAAFTILSSRREDMRAALEKLGAEDAVPHAANYLPSVSGIIHASKSLPDPSAFFRRLNIAWVSVLQNGAKLTSKSFEFEVVMVLSTLAFLYVRFLFFEEKNLTKKVLTFIFSFFFLSSSSRHRATAAKKLSILLSTSTGDVKIIGQHLLAAAGIFQHLHTQMGGMGWQTDHGMLEHMGEAWAALQEVSHAEFMQVSLEQAVAKKMADSLLAKLCVEIAHKYAAAVEFLRQVERRNGKPCLGELTYYCAGSQSLYNALSYVFLARDAVLNKAYGVSVARYKLALELLQPIKIPSKAPPLEPLVKMIHAHKAKISELAAAAEKDNSQVYFERIPAVTDPAVVTRPEGKAIGTPTPFVVPDPIHIPIVLAEVSSCSLQ